MRITRFRTAVVAVLALSGLVASPPPASAHLMSGSFMGTASTPGTWAPASPVCGSSPCPNQGVWSFASTVDFITTNGEEPTLGSGGVSWSGVFTGWCGEASGTVTLNVLGELLAVDWLHAGNVVIFTTIGGSGHAWVLGGAVFSPARGTGNCITAPGTAFDVVGGITVAP